MGKPPPLEATWNKIIRILLSSKGPSPLTEEVRAYQRDHLGREGNGTCLLELLPLPSPSTSKWLYADSVSIPSLANRQAYRDWLTPIRIQRLQERIKNYRPPFVIFYGKTYLDHWQAIAGVPFQKEPNLDVRTARSHGTFYMVTNHPVATGVKNEYFHEVGKLLMNTK